MLLVHVQERVARGHALHQLHDVWTKLAVWRSCGSVQLLKVLLVGLLLYRLPVEINKLVQTKYVFVYAVCIHSFNKLFVHNRNVYIVLVLVIQIIRKGTGITSGTARTFATKKIIF